MRVKGGFTRHKRVKKILKRAKGFRGAASRQYCVAKEKVMHAERYQYVSRRILKRDMRALWIQRINIAVRLNDPDMNYSTFIHGLKNAAIDLDRKVLAQMAVDQKEIFAQIVQTAKNAL
jgi:large subunit ribosomal protein L20